MASLRFFMECDLFGKGIGTQTKQLYSLFYKVDYFRKFIVAVELDKYVDILKYK